MSRPLPLPPPMQPEPLIRVLADHRLQGLGEELGIGFYILFEITGTDQFKGGFDDETMFLKSVPDHKNRHNRCPSLQRQGSQPRSGRSLSTKEIHPYPSAPFRPLIDQDSDDSVFRKGFDYVSDRIFRNDHLKTCYLSYSRNPLIDPCLIDRFGND